MTCLCLVGENSSLGDLKAIPTRAPADETGADSYTEDGQKNRQATNESYLFSLEEEKWTKTSYVGTVFPRERLVTQAVVVNGSMFIIGGWDPGHAKDGGKILSDIWKLDLQTWEWTEVHLQGMQFQPASRHQAVAVGSDIYIHTHRNTDTILHLDVEASPPKLSSLSTSGPNGFPASRGLHSLTAVGNALYLFGGAPKTGGMLGDQWRLDLGTLEWHQITADGNLPHVRCSHAAAPCGAQAVYLGGSYYREAGGLQALNDVFAFDTQLHKWRIPQSPAGGPCPRNAHSMTLLQNGCLLVYGGWKPFEETYNDTFLLSPANLKW